jgi:hypothetical protein
VPGSTATENFTGFMIHKRDQIGCSISAVMGFPVQRTISLKRIRGATRQRLYPGAFVKMKKIFWRIRIYVEDVIHFWEKIRIGDIQKVPLPVRPKYVRFEKSVNA